MRHSPWTVMFSPPGPASLRLVRLMGTEQDLSFVVGSSAVDWVAHPPPFDSTTCVPHSLIASITTLMWPPVRSTIRPPSGTFHSVLLTLPHLGLVAPAWAAVALATIAAAADTHLLFFF